jgi:hypothetical protein
MLDCNNLERVYLSMENDRVRAKNAERLTNKPGSRGRFFIIVFCISSFGIPARKLPEAVIHLYAVQGL